MRIVEDALHRVAVAALPGHDLAAGDALPGEVAVQTGDVLRVLQRGAVQFGDVPGGRVAGRRALVDDGRAAAVQIEQLRRMLALDPGARGLAFLPRIAGEAATD